MSLSVLGKLTVFTTIWWEEIQISSLLLAVKVVAPSKEMFPSSWGCHGHLGQKCGVISAGLGICEISCFPFIIHGEDKKLWIAPSATAFKQQQTLDLRLQGPRKEFPFGEELCVHTHKHILEHKKYAPQVKKGLQMGQHSVPWWHVESSLPESWPACLVHGLRSCWFPDFGFGKVFSIRSDCKRQDPSASTVPQKVEIL